MQEQRSDKPQNGAKKVTLFEEIRQINSVVAGKVKTETTVLLRNTASMVKTMQEKSKSLWNKQMIITGYLLLVIFVMAFCELESVGSVPLRVSYVPINKVYCIVIATGLASVGIFWLDGFRLKLDKVLICLIAKCALDLIPFLTRPEMRTAANLYLYGLVLVLPLVYYVFQNFTGDINLVVKALTILGVVIVVQIGLTALISGLPLFSEQYKHFMRIPIAHSNIIGAIILMILFLRLKLHLNTPLDWVINGAMFFGLVLTESRGAWVMLLVGAALIVLEWLWNNRFFAVLKAGGIAFGVIAGLLGLAVWAGVVDLSSFSSGRTQIWGLAVEKWLTSPWFGNGVTTTSYDIGFEVITTGVHNIVLDNLVQSGIVGTVVYGGALYFGAFTHGRKTPIASGMMMAIMLLLCFSMIEVCYNSLPCQVLLWMGIGLLNSQSMENVI